MTRLEDTIRDTETLLKLSVERSNRQAKMRASGIARNDAEFDARAAGEGEFTTLRNYNPLIQTESKVVSNDESVRGVAGKIGMNKQTAVKHFRANGWGSNDLTAQLLANDPMEAIAALTGDYWANDEDIQILSALRAIAAKAEADMVHGDETVEIGLNAFIDAVQKLGDAKTKIKTALVHSSIHAAMQRLQGNGYVPTAATDLGFGQFAGLNLYVTDTMPVETLNGVATYTSILCSDAAVLVGEASAKVPVAYVRDEHAADFGGTETVIMRKNKLIHVNGYSWDMEADIAGVSPTNAEFATAANWTRKFDRKSVGLVFLKTNAS